MILRPGQIGEQEPSYGRHLPSNVLIAQTPLLSSKTPKLAIDLGTLNCSRRGWGEIEEACREWRESLLEKVVLGLVLEGRFRGAL